MPISHGLGSVSCLICPAEQTASLACRTSRGFRSSALLRALGHTAGGRPMEGCDVTPWPCPETSTPDEIGCTSGHAAAAMAGWQMRPIAERLKGWGERRTVLPWKHQTSQSPILAVPPSNTRLRDKGMEGMSCFVACLEPKG